MEPSHTRRPVVHDHNGPCCLERAEKYRNPNAAACMTHKFVSMAVDRALDAINVSPLKNQYQHLTGIHVSDNVVETRSRPITKNVIFKI